MWLDHVDRVITFQHQPGVSAFTFTGCNHSHQIYLEGIDLHNCFPLFLPAHNLQGWFLVQARAEESCYCFPHCSTSEPESPDVPQRVTCQFQYKSYQNLIKCLLEIIQPSSPTTPEKAQPQPNGAVHAHAWGLLLSFLLLLYYWERHCSRDIALTS